VQLGVQLTGRPGQHRELGEVTTQAVRQQHQQDPAVCTYHQPSVA
jgi:hypothetical protein